MSDETTLLPCPFCGGEAEVIEADYGMYMTGYAVYCRKCCLKLGVTGRLGETYEWSPVFNTEAEAITAWNTRADYHGYEQAAIEAWKSIKTWNTRATHDTLTAEQVEKAIRDCSIYASYDGCTYYASGIRLQAIADELNAAMGGGTCENANKDGYGFRFDCTECGYSTIVLNCATRLDELPNFCPKCGRWVKR